MTTRIAATLCVAVALVLPGTAAARPIDDGPRMTPTASPPPETVAIATAGLTLVRLSPRKVHS